MTDLDHPYRGIPPTQPVWGSLRKPDEPPAPTTEEWLKRIMSRQANPDGSPMPSVRQSERQAPDWTGPMIKPKERP